MLSLNACSEMRSATANRLSELDGVRAVAILMVVFWHWVHVPMIATGGLHIFTRMTWSGVDLFFVLSGFLIGGILMQNRESERYYKTFYLRRLWRILPLYLLVLGVALALGSQTVLSRLPELRPIFAYELPAYTFFLQVQNIAMALQGKFAQQALTVTWSLALEEQFYLILPLVVRLCRPRLLPWICGFFVVSAPMIRIGLHAVNPEGARFWSYVSLPCRWDALFLGVLVAYCWREEKARVLLVRWRRGLFAVWGCLLVAMGWMCLSAKGVIMSDFMTRCGYSIVGCFYATGLALVLCFRGQTALGWLSGKPLVAIGVASYGIYLLHEPIHSTVKAYLPFLHWPAAILLSGVLVGVATAVSWRWLESPALRFAQRYRY